MKFQSIILGKQNQCEWAKRKGNENTIGRMYSANPCQVELFYLRLLLSFVKGKQSFNEIRVVGGWFL